MPLLLPRDARDAVEKCGPSAIMNFALLFNRYVEDGISASQYKQTQMVRINSAWNLDIGDDVNAFLTRHQTAIELVSSDHKERLVKIRITTRSRMVVGSGNPSVFENGLTLHHILGLPYIPGSSLKGLVLNWLNEGVYWEHALGEVGEFRSRAGIDLDEYDNWVIPIFGASDAQGLAKFYDAMPGNVPRFEIDIMNPHYQEYYEELPIIENPTNPPADWYQPIPIPFLTIGPGAKFFLYASMAKSAGWDADAFDMGEKLLRRWIVGALANYGIGGKTRKGYGQVSLEDM